MPATSKPKTKSSKKAKANPVEEEDVTKIIADKENEIAELNERIKFLSLEVRTLRKKTPKIDTPSSQEAENFQQPKIPKKKPSSRGLNVTLAVPETPVRPRRLSSSSITKVKGCTCKGNCSTKLCGCVKKDQHCSEFCKCSDSCRNSDPDLDVNNDKENEENNVDDVFSEDEHNNSSQNTNSSPSTSGSSSIDEADSNFNPMKPTRTLMRSPLPNQSITSNHSMNLRSPLGPSPNRLNVLSPDGHIITPKIEPLNSASSEDFEIIADWDEHKNRLVHCSKCKRTFFPERIKIHEASCKKV